MNEFGFACHEILRVDCSKRAAWKSSRIPGSSWVCIRWCNRSSFYITWLTLSWLLFFLRAFNSFSSVDFEQPACQHVWWHGDVKKKFIWTCFDNEWMFFGVTLRFHLHLWGTAPFQGVVFPTTRSCQSQHSPLVSLLRHSDVLLAAVLYSIDNHWVQQQKTRSRTAACLWPWKVSRLEMSSVRPSTFCHYLCNTSCLSCGLKTISSTSNDNKASALPVGCQRHFRDIEE